MALPPLPANNTGRVFIDYNDSYNDHTFAVRYQNTSNAQNALNAVRFWLDDLAPLLDDDWVIIGVRHQAAGSLVQLPISTGAFDGWVGTATSPPSQANAPRQCVWVGRSLTSGRRVSVSLFGLSITTPVDFRFQVGADMGSAMAGSIDQLNLFTSEFVAIDGSKPSWYPYVNVNYNSYWETAARG